MEQLHLRDLLSRDLHEGPDVDPIRVFGKGSTVSGFATLAGACVTFYAAVTQSVRAAVRHRNQTKTPPIR